LAYSRTFGLNEPVDIERMQAINEELDQQWELVSAC